MAVTLDQLEQLYLAYFGRPADFQGVAFYTANPSVTIEDVAATFGTSAESVGLYGAGFSPSVINAIYQNLFNRDADPEGLLFWSQVVARGDLSPAGAALAILQGARNADAIAIQNKLAAATAFTNALDTAPEILGYAGQNAAALARAQLHAVTDDATTLTNYIANVDAEVAAVIGVGGTIGQDFTLTTNVDTINITDATTINTVHGVIDGAKSTFSVGDTINGNGKTIVSLAVASSGTADFATLKNVKEVDILAGTTGNINFDALSWSGVGSVNLIAGKSADVFVDNLNKGAGLSMATGIGGQVSASYTNGHFAWIQADKAGSISYADGGAIVGVAGAAGYASASVDAEAANVDLSVGDIKLTNAGGSASSLYAGVFNTQDKGGDINVGNVTLSGASHVWLTVENTNHTSSSDAVSTKVGNVTVNVAASGTLENFEIHQTSAGPVGDLTVGDVSITLGKNGTTSSGVTIENTGAATVGETTVGSVNLTLGKGASMSMTIEAYAHTGTGSATVGGLTIGNITQTLAQSASMDYFEIYHSAYASGGSGDVTVGTTTLGAVSINVGQSANWYGSVDVSAYNGGTGTASVGNVSIASINLVAGLDSTLEWSSTISADAAGGGDATVGDVAVGDQTLTLGIGAYMSFTNTIKATGSTSSAIGNVILGNATITGDDGSTLDYFMYDIVSSGSIGDVTVGNMTITGGVQADLSSYYTVDAAKAVGNVTFGSTTLSGGKSADIFTEHNITAATVGNVTVGDMSITGVTNATMYASLSVSADTIGTVSVGNLSAAAGKSGSSTIDVNVGATTEAGNVTVGAVNVAALGLNSTAEVNVNVYGQGGTAADLGSLTVGNVTMNVKGTSAYGQFSATLGASADTAGTLTVGNMDLSVGNKAKMTGAQLYVNVDNEGGNAVVGNITLHGTSVRATTDTTMTYTADVNVTASGKVTVGNITVTGGDGASDNFNNLAFLHLTSNAATPSVTIGNVDYSGYGAKATIDVSAYKGAASIVGTAKDDTITDNKGTNSLTGGAGADKFVFNASNANLTLATVDTITDFSEGQHDKISVVGGFAVALDPNSNYGENTYADFAAFVSGANASNKEVLVGQVGGDSFVAIDAGNDGTVDFIVKLAGVSLSQINVADFV